jgi:hypothetical protein
LSWCGSTIAVTIKHAAGFWAGRSPCIYLKGIVKKALGDRLNILFSIRLIKKELASRREKMSSIVAMRKRMDTVMSSASNRVCFGIPATPAFTEQLPDYSKTNKASSIPSAAMVFCAQVFRSRLFYKAYLRHPTNVEASTLHS